MKRKPNKNLKIVPLPEDKNKINIFNRNLLNLKVKDVRRAYSKLIQDYCKGLVNNEDAKTVAYMFSGYLQLVRDTEFTERLKTLEERILNEK
ncbi:MAG: hypothetical protein WCA84_11850 [Ignavibacteriaceae bacterium]